MVGKRALEIQETKLPNCEVTPQAISPIAKSLTKWGWTKGPMVRQAPYFIQSIKPTQLQTA
jgi:hypothetical protein